MQSFGKQSHFTKENAPAGAPIRCADGGCPVGDTCPYNCTRYYYEERPENRCKIITNSIAACSVPAGEEVLQPLHSNTVVDVQEMVRQYELAD